MAEAIYGNFVSKESFEVADLYFQLTRRYASPSDLAHYNWARLKEGLTHEQVLAKVRQEHGGENPGPTPPNPQPNPPNDWERMVRETIHAAFREGGRGKPTEDQIQFVLGKAKNEGWTHVEIQAYVRSLPPSAPDGREGLVTLDRRSFKDDDGPFFAIGKTFFWAVRAYINERERLVQNIEWLASFKAIDYVRVLSMVGWEGLEIDPRREDHFNVLGQVIDLFYEHGIRTQLVVFADAQKVMPDTRDREAYCDRIIDEVVNPRVHKLMFVETANEYWQNGFSSDGVELRNLTRRMQARTPVIVASSAAHFDGETKAAFQEGYLRATIGTRLAVPHFSREFKGDGPYRPIRQPWEYQFEVQPGMPEAFTNNEPIGFTSSVNSDDSPGRMVLGALVTALSTGAGYCLHTGTGVTGTVVPERGRVANFFETPGLMQTLESLKKLKDLLPGDISNWAPKNWAPNWNPPMQFVGSGEEYERTIVRSFAMEHGNAFIWAPMGIRDPNVPAKFRTREACTLIIYDPSTMERRGVLNLGPGTRIEVSVDSIVFGEIR